MTMELKWIKLPTALPYDSKICYLRQQKNGSDLVTLWIFLLCKAGQINDGGRIYIAQGIPYTAKALAAEFGIKPNIANAALPIYEQLGLLETLDDGTMRVVDWIDQGTDKTAIKREQARERQSAFRARNADRNANSNADSNASNADRNANSNASNADKNKNKNKNKNKEKDIEKENDDYYYNYYNVIDYAKSTFGALSDGNKDELKRYAEAMQPDTVQLAIDVASAAGRPTWAYTRGVLKNWQAKGVLNAEAARAICAAYKGPQGAHGYEERQYSDEDYANIFINLDDYEEEDETS